MNESATRYNNNIIDYEYCRYCATMLSFIFCCGACALPASTGFVVTRLFVILQNGTEQYASAFSPLRSESVRTRAQGQQQQQEG